MALKQLSSLLQTTGMLCQRSETANGQPVLCRAGKKSNNISGMKIKYTNSRGGKQSNASVAFTVNPGPNANCPDREICLLKDHGDERAYFCHVFAEESNA